MAERGEKTRANPLDPEDKLGSGIQPRASESEVHPQSSIVDWDSAMTKAEKTERHSNDDFQTSPAKKMKLDHATEVNKTANAPQSERRKGVAPIKPELVLLIQKGAYHIQRSRS